MACDPHDLFDQWFAEARTAEPEWPEAVALATADARGAPSVRMVLMKAHDQSGFVFYSNSQSRKGDELRANPQAALLFHWKSLRRQIRIEGAVSPVSDEEADAYFVTRARESQLGAWASDQSRPMPSRATFESRFDEMAARFADIQVQRPPHWIGYRLAPERIEFWTDGAHRLHERRLFTPGEAGWSEILLYP